MPAGNLRLPSSITSPRFANTQGPRFSHRGIYSSRVDEIAMDHPGLYLWVATRDGARSHGRWKPWVAVGSSAALAAVIRGRFVVTWAT